MNLRSVFYSTRLQDNASLATEREPSRKVGTGAFSSQQMCNTAQNWFPGIYIYLLTHFTSNKLYSIWKVKWLALLSNYYNPYPSPLINVTEQHITCPILNWVHTGRWEASVWQQVGVRDPALVAGPCQRSNWSTEEKFSGQGHAWVTPLSLFQSQNEEGGCLGMN